MIVKKSLSPEAVDMTNLALLTRFNEIAFNQIAQPEKRVCDRGLKL